MRVLYLTHRLPYAPNRGDRIRAYYTLRELARYAQVSLFSFVHDGEEASQAASQPFVSQVRVARIPRVRGLIKAASRLPWRTPLTHCLLDAPGIRRHLDALVRANAPDVVLAYCSGMAPFAMAPPLDDLPFVLDMVDVDSVKWTRLASSSRWLRRWVYAREARTLAHFESEASARAQMTLVVNARERAALNRVAPGVPSAVISNGVDLHAFANPNAPASEPIVAFCGVMDYAPNEEGVRWFIEHVWPLVRAKRADARFVVIGARPTAWLRRAAARDGSIELTGRVPEVQCHLWRAAVSVAPLRVAQGLQNKVLEALAAGLPVVVTSVVAEGLPAAALPACTVSDSPPEFADAVLGILARSPEGRLRLAASACLTGLAWTEQLRPLRAILERARAGGDRRGRPK